MLTVPAKYKRCGIKVKCLKCKKQVTTKCGMTSKPLKTCEFAAQHRYNLIVCVPKGEGARRMRIVASTDFDSALKELAVFKTELKSSGYVKRIEDAKTSTLLSYFIHEYVKVLSGRNPVAHLNRERSKEYIQESERAIARFLIALREAGYTIETLDAKDVKDYEVGVFHDYLLKTRKLGQRTYNKHMAILKALFNWISHEHGYAVKNAFNRVELCSVKQDATIITRTEFQDLLNVICHENGWDNVSRKNLYRPWLVTAYLLALETGLRREELLTLQWTDIIPIDDNKLIFRVSNLKVNRIMKGRKSGERIKYIPITKGLMSLLNNLGYMEKKGSTEYIIVREGIELPSAMDLLSRSFGHFIKLVAQRPLEFGVLRKTYITKLTMVAGPNAKLFTGSSSEEVLKNHYLSRAFMAANLDDFSVL